MRTGIYYPTHNRYSYSDFRQTVTIPWGVSTALLGFWAYPITGEPSSISIPEAPTSIEELELAFSPDSGDVQYLLMLDQWFNWIATPLWRKSNARVWQYFLYDVRPWRGSTINLQFGTYNNGWSGVTSQFIDDANLWTCP